MRFTTGYVGHSNHSKIWLFVKKICSRNQLSWHSISNVKLKVVLHHLLLKRLLQLLLLLHPLLLLSDFLEELVVICVLVVTSVEEAPFGLRCSELSDQYFLC